MREINYLVKKRTTLDVVEFIHFGTFLNVFFVFNKKQEVFLEIFLVNFLVALTVFGIIAVYFLNCFLTFFLNIAIIF